MRVSRLTAAAVTDILGKRVQKAAATLPATTTQSLFTVSGGLCLVTMLIGEVTTVIQTQANATKLLLDGVVDTDLCATLDITADAVGTRYGVTGIFGDAMVGLGSAVNAPTRPFIVDTGTIKLSCAATNTGATKWDIWYIALDAGAAIVSA